MQQPVQPVGVPLSMGLNLRMHTLQHCRGSLSVFWLAVDFAQSLKIEHHDGIACRNYVVGYFNRAPDERG